MWWGWVKICGVCGYTFLAWLKILKVASKKLYQGTLKHTTNDEIKGIIRIVKSLEDSGLLLKGVSTTIQN